MKERYLQSKSLLFVINFFSVKRPMLFAAGDEMRKKKELCFYLKFARAFSKVLLEATMYP